MIQIAICDDEAYMMDLLTGKVSKYFNNENIQICISGFSNGMALLSSDKKFDIVFLDVQMEHPDGFETAAELRRRDFNGFLIFVTIMREAVFRAFEVQAFDYLVKPLLEEDFKRTMHRLLNAIRGQNQKQLLIQRGNEWSMVSFDEIMYCEIINRKIYLHLNDGTVLDYYEKIENLEKKLDGRFFKCHRSYLVNLQYLKSYKAKEAYLTNKESIPVSRLRSDEFSSAVLWYMKKREGGT